MQKRRPPCRREAPGRLGASGPGYRGFLHPAWTWHGRCPGVGCVWPRIPGLRAPNPSSMAVGVAGGLRCGRARDPGGEGPLHRLVDVMYLMGVCRDGAGEG
jgi:hypothetical protein